MYAAFLGDRPLTRVEYVLTSEIPTGIRDIDIDIHVQFAPYGAYFCVFYSVAIVEAGDLLRRVVKLPKAENMSYVTLSPIPRFRRENASYSAVNYDDVVAYLKARRCSVCRFHMRNGAILRDVLLDMDASALRAEKMAPFQVAHVLQAVVR